MGVRQPEVRCQLPDPRLRVVSRGKFNALYHYFVCLRPRSGERIWELAVVACKLCGIDEIACEGDDAHLNENTTCPNHGMTYRVKRQGIAFACEM